MVAGLGSWMMGGSPMLIALKKQGWNKVTDDSIAKTFGYLEFCLKLGDSCTDLHLIFS